MKNTKKNLLPKEQRNMKTNKANEGQQNNIKLKFETVTSLLEPIRSFLIENQSSKEEHQAQIDLSKNQQKQRRYSSFVQACKKIQSMNKNKFTSSLIEQTDKPLLFQEIISINAQISHYLDTINDQKQKAFLVKAFQTLIKFSIHFFTTIELKLSIIKKYTKCLLTGFFKIDFETEDFKKQPKYLTQNGKTNKSVMSLSFCNNKICRGFYYLFQIIQEYMSERRVTFENSFQKLSKLISDLTSFILLQNEAISNEIKFKFIESVTTNVGCYQLPVLYLFNHSIVQIIQKQFSKKYSSGQGENYIQNFSKQLFSFKFLQLFINLIRNFGKDKLMECKLLIFKQTKQEMDANNNNNTQENYQKKTQQNQKIFAAKQNLCCYCGTSISDSNRVKLSYTQCRTKSQIKNVTIQLFVCDDCLIQSGFDLQTKVVHESDQFRQFQFPKQLLLALALNGYSKQQFDIEQLKKLKKYHKNLLLSSINQKDNESIQIHDRIAINDVSFQPSLSFRCLKWLYFQGLGQPVQNKKNKKKSVSKHSQNQIKRQIKKVLTLIQILINNLHQKIRINSLDFITKIKLQILYYFQPIQIQNLVVCFIQGRFNNLQTRHQDSLKFKYVQLIKAVILRLDDSQQSVRLKAFHCILSFQSSLNSKIIQIKLIEKLFKFLLQNPQKCSVQIIKLCDFIVFPNYQVTFSIKEQNQILNQAVIMAFKMFPTLKQNSYDEVKIQLSSFAKKCMKLLQEMNILNKLQQVPQNQEDVSTTNSIILNFLHQVLFTPESIKCFSISQATLENIFNNLPLQNYSDNIFANIKLIFQQVCQEIFIVNQKISKSRKSIKTKMSKNKSKKTSQSFIELNLNRLISIMLNYQGLAPSKCQILKILLQKNYLLNYENQYFTQSPCKIKKLILSIQSRKKMLQLITNIQSAYQDCPNNDLQCLIQLHVISCLTISAQKRIQLIFYKYKNVGQYFKKEWLLQIQKRQQTDPSFLIRTMKILTFQIVQKEKYNKIHQLTNNRYSYFQKNAQDKSKYKIFSSFTQQVIKKLQCEPETLFIQNYQMNIALLQICNEKKPKNFQQIVQYVFSSFQRFYNVHPELILHSHHIIKQTIINSDHSSLGIYNYLFLFLKNLANIQNSYILQIVQKIYKHRGEPLLKRLSIILFRTEQPEKTSVLINIVQTLNQLILVQNMGVHQASEQIIYCIFCKQIEVCYKSIQILNVLRQKQLDGMVLSQVCDSLQKIFEDFYQVYYQQINPLKNNYFVFPFERVNLLCKINKSQTKSNKVLLQKDLRVISLRSTFVKKVAENISTISSIETLSNKKKYFYLFLLKLLQHIQEMDVYQYKQILFAIHKLINQSYAQIIGISNLEQNQTVSFKNFKNRSLQSLILLQQFLFYLVFITKGKKVQDVKKQLQKNLVLGKFTTTSLQVRTSITKQDQILIKQNIQSYFYIQSHQNILSLRQQMNKPAQNTSRQQKQKQFVKVICVQIQHLHLTTLGCKFAHKKQKQSKNDNKKQKKEGNKRMILQSDEQSCSISDDSQTQSYLNSVQSTSDSTLKIQQIKFNEFAQNDSKRTLFNKNVKTLNQHDKKITKKVPKSVSAPKIRINLSSILEEDNEGQLIRRSKRLKQKIKLS